MAAIVFCAALLLCALVTKSHTLSWNDRSRLATIDALVAHHSFAIEASKFAAGTEDKYRYNAHVYSDKPPALALQGAIVAEALQPFAITLARRPAQAIYLITLFTVGFWFAVGCSYAYAFQRLLGFERRGAAFVAAMTGLGTLALPYATVLSNHVPAGAAALAGIYHIKQARDGGWNLPLGAMFLALAYAFDASSIVFAIAAIVLLWQSPPSLWFGFMAWCVPVVGAQLVFNAHFSAGLGPPAMNQTSWSEPSSPFNRGTNQSPFFLGSPLGYARYAAYLLLGDKGLISYTPLTLLCAYGLAQMYRQKLAMRRLAIAISTTSFMYFGLVVAFTDDYRALNYGERRYVDLFFVLCIALGPALSMLRLTAARIAARVAVVASISIASLGTIAPFGEVRLVSGYAFAFEELHRLGHRAPFQALLDIAVLISTIALVLRFWWTPATPTPDNGLPGASP